MRINDSISIVIHIFSAQRAASEGYKTISYGGYLLNPRDTRYEAPTGDLSLLYENKRNELNLHRSLSNKEKQVVGIIRRIQWCQYGLNTTFYGLLLKMSA